MRKRSKIVSDQRGVLSVITVLLIILLLSVIVLSLTQISVREQRQALDRQLSTQAYYAAESGVNNAIKAISGGYTASKTTCGSDSNNASLNDSALTLNGTGTVSVSCLLINQAPKSIVYDTVEQQKAKVLVIESTSTISSIELFWEAKDGIKSTVGQSTNPGTSNYSMLRASLTPIISGDNLRESMRSNARTFFIRPTNTGGSVSFSGSNSSVQNGTCGSVIKDCAFTISGLVTNKYLLRLSSVYKPASVVVKIKGSGGGDLAFKNAQAVIDSTGVVSGGKANDVVRRVQVRYALKNNYEDTLNFAVSSEKDICKQLLVGTTGPGDQCPL